MPFRKSIRYATYTFFLSVYNDLGTPYRSIHILSSLIAASVVSSSENNDILTPVASSIITIRQHFSPLGPNHL